MGNHCTKCEQNYPILSKDITKKKNIYHKNLPYSLHFDRELNATVHQQQVFLNHSTKYALYKSTSDITTHSWTVLINTDFWNGVKWYFTCSSNERYMIIVPNSEQNQHSSLRFHNKHTQFVQQFTTKITYIWHGAKLLFGTWYNIWRKSHSYIPWFYHYGAGNITSMLIYC